MLCFSVIRMVLTEGIRRVPSPIVPSIIFYILSVFPYPCHVCYRSFISLFSISLFYLSQCPSFIIIVSRIFYNTKFLVHHLRLLTPSHKVSDISVCGRSKQEKFSLWLLTLIRFLFATGFFVSMFSLFYVCVNACSLYSWYQRHTWKNNNDNIITATIQFPYIYFLCRYGSILNSHYNAHSYLILQQMTSGENIML